MHLRSLLFTICITFMATLQPAATYVRILASRAAFYIAASHFPPSCMGEETDQDAKYKRNALVVASPLSQCSKRIDKKTGAETQPKILILHYTVSSLAQTLFIFLGHKEEAPVAAHYTISKDGYIFQHVRESVAAHHAGISFWRNLENLNAYSIGVEHVNRGYKEHPNQPQGIIVPGSPKEWYHFEAKQIAASITLCKQIIAEHRIESRNVVGHSDIAPGRKSDPGPLFPWEQFAQAGVGAWPDMNKAEPLPCLTKASQYNREEEWLLEHLHLWGYTKANNNTSNQDIIRAFQMHFRQNNISGKADSETIQVLSSLLQTYDIAKQEACPCQKY